MPQEEGHVIVDRPRLNHVVVVEDQRELAGRGLELVDQDSHDPLARDDAGRSQEWKHVLGVTPSCTIERNDNVTPEPHRIVVIGIQRQPRHRALRTCGPVGDQGRLAEAGGSAHQDHLPGHPRVESLDQPGSAEAVGTSLRDGELGGDDLVSLRCCCGFVRRRCA